MAAQRQDDERVHGQGATGKTLKRRGILAAAGVVVAGIVAKQTSQPAAAYIDVFFEANGSTGPPAFFTSSNTYNQGVSAFGITDGVKGTTGTGHGVYGVAGDNGTGVRGEATTVSGVTGIATSGYGGLFTSHGTLPGLRGENDNASGIGVYGEAIGATGYGVVGGRNAVSGNPFNGSGVRGLSDGGYGVEGISIGQGVHGASTGSGGYGVYGVADSSSGAGVFGISANGQGVYGKSSGSHAIIGNLLAPANSSLAGVQGIGNGAGNYGVYGYAAGGTGVYGYVNTNGAGAIGVRGQIASGTTGASGIAVYGENLSTGANGYGVKGISATSHGVYGEAGNSQGAGGVVGVSRVANGVGFQALAVSPATYAGFFVGTVSITGSLGVSGGKFAVVKGSDGQYRGMYAVESPECWFEDVGTGTLVNGVATVKLDPLFAQHVHTDDYHVFLTPHDGEHNLAVPARAGQSFSVEANPSVNAAAKGKKATNLSGTFSYRVVAKRNDIKGERMPVWEMPAGITIPDPPKVDPSPLPPVASAPTMSVPTPQPVPSPVPPVAASSPVVSPAAPAPNPLPPSRP